MDNNSRLKVGDIVQHYSETKEKLVVYQALYKDESQVSILDYM